MTTRRFITLLPLLAFVLACSGVPGLLASTPRVTYPGASAMALDDDERAEAFTALFSSQSFGFETQTVFATTEDSQDDVLDYFDDSLANGDWEMLTDDWLERGSDQLWSVWGKEERYGVFILIAADLDSDGIDYFDDEIGIEGLERGQTLIVTHTWDVSRITTRSGEAPAEWDEESFDDLGIRVYLPGEWSADETNSQTVSLNGSYAYLYRLDGDDFGDFSLNFDEEAGAPELIESFLDEQDFDAVGEIESISTGAGQGSRVFFKIEGDQYGYLAALPVEDEAIILVTTNAFTEDEDWLGLQLGVLDAVFASIRLDE